MEKKHTEESLIAIPYGDSKIDALYYKSKTGKKDFEDVLVLHIHGFLGNFLDGSQRFLPPLLARAGYSSLAINTRMANFGLFFGFGLLEDTVPQIDTVIEFAQGLGYKKILLSGYSLGGSVVLHYANISSEYVNRLNLTGIIALATPFSMPDSIRRRWIKWGSQPSYDQIYEEAKQILGGDPDNAAEDRTIIIFKARGDGYQPQDTEIYTYKTWWSLAGPEAESAKGYKQIENITLPILLVQGWNDEVLKSNEAYDLARIAIEAGNKDVSVFYVNTGHSMEGKEDELADIIINWLQRRQ